ncbi:hypothetical protein Tco_1299294 [Tanacetum coccineum]
MDREVKSLKRSRILLVKVRWNSKRDPEFTWERDDYMKSKYPQLFIDRTGDSAKGQQYPHDLRKPLPLISNTRGRQVIPFDHFINNDLAYLSGGVSSRKYATSVTKTKAADYGNIKWIEDLVPNSIWSEVPVSYDKYALWGISHWGRKRQQFYGYAANRESAKDVYSRRRIIAVTKLQIIEWHGYKHLDWITVRRDDDKLYSFKEGDLKRLRLQDIEDMLILLVQGKLSNLKIEERLAFSVALRMFTRSIVIQRRVEDFQLGVESYQKKLNITKPDTYRSDLRRREQYTAYSSPRGFIYQNKDKKNRLMRLDELHKFSDGTLDDVRTALDDRLKGIRMEYLPKTIWRQSDRERATAMIQAIDKRLKSRRIMRSLEKFVGGRPYEDKMNSMHSTLSMYYDYGAHVKGELFSDDEKLSKNILRVLRIILEILPEHPSDIIHSEDGNPAVTPSKSGSSGMVTFGVLRQSTTIKI